MTLLLNEKQVTVVIPTYNRSAELKRALDSLVAQSDPEFDVIVCDDGSTEDIYEVVRSYINSLRITMLRIENSGGPARPRNIAIEAAQTPWVSLLDSDDWWLSHRMAALKAELDTEHEIVYHQLQVVRADLSKKKRPPHGSIMGSGFRGEDSLLHMLRFGNPLPTSAVTVRTDRIKNIGGFSESGVVSVEDYDAWLRLASNGARFKFVPKVLGNYWCGNDHISEFSVEQYHRQKELFDRTLKWLPSHYLPWAESNFNYLLGSYALNLGLPRAEEHYKRISSRHEPVRWLKALVRLQCSRFIR